MAVMGRDSGLDFLRGIAIVGMVLSGTISRNPALPGLLFHAQIGPPDFLFNPNQPGITWVDLVFPFFLFAMGMAIPLSLNKVLESGAKRRSVVKKLFMRSLKLWFFSLMLGHLSVFHYSSSIGFWSNFLPLLAFAGFFMAFIDKRNLPLNNWWLNFTGYAVLLVLCFVRQWVFDLPFSLQQHDIIILVFANMAFFGGMVWLFTRSHLLARLGFLVILFGLRLTSGIEGSWNQALWNLVPLWWLSEQIPVFGTFLHGLGLESGKTIFYHPEFLKYLFIVIPGTIAGDLVIKRKGAIADMSLSSNRITALAMILLILINLSGLYLRMVKLNIILNGLVLFFFYLHLHRNTYKRQELFRELTFFGVFWVFTGLIFEPWEGGIKKDPATYSYLFLTTGLAIFVYLAFHMLYKQNKKPAWKQPLQAIGQNPMLAYVSVGYLIIPLLSLLHLLNPLDRMHQAWEWAGLLRGMVLTAISVFVTIFSVRKNYFWKT